MQIRKHVARIARCVPLIFLTACVGQIDDAGGAGNPSVADEALVSTTANPPLRGTVAGAMPALFPGRADSRGGISNIPEELNHAPSGSSSSWLTSAVGTAHETSSAFSTRLSSALDEARAERVRRENDWRAVFDAIELLADYNGVEVHAGQDVNSHFGYRPERARWLDRENNVSFADPGNYGELRQRGARLYCAAKEAFAQGGGDSQIMGRKSLASLSVVGQRIDFLTVEPTVALAAPKKYLSNANDGAQAFNIPLTVGARLSLLSLLPSLPELRTPVSFVTADSETMSRADVSANTTQFWQTVSHSDAFLSSTRSESSIAPDPITLFNVGPIAVQLGMDLKIHNQGCSQASDIHQCTASPWVPVKRLLDHAGLAPRRAGRTSGEMDGVTYNDNYWVMADVSGRIGGSANESVPLGGLSSSYFTRATTNNDKSFEVRTGIEAVMLLLAGGSYSAGPIDIALNIGGTIEGDVDVVHRVREQMMAGQRPDPLDEFHQPVWYPETSLSVTPHTETRLGMGLYADVILTVDLPVIGRTEIKEELIDEDLAYTQEIGRDWDERNRLRIGTMTRATPASELRSHWPEPDGTLTGFRAMPDSLATCLAGAAPTGDLSEPCDSVDGSYTDAVVAPPQAEICVVAQTTYVEWDDSYPDDRCRIHLANYVSRGISQPKGLTHRSRVLRSKASGDELKVVLDECARAFGSKAAINDLVEIGLCSTIGREFDRPVTFVSAPANGPLLEVDECHAD